jgi:hypothetical protein
VDDPARLRVRRTRHSAGEKVCHVANGTEKPTSATNDFRDVARLMFQPCDPAQLLLACLAFRYAKCGERPSLSLRSLPLALGRRITRPLDAG